MFIKTSYAICQSHNGDHFPTCVWKKYTCSIKSPILVYAWPNPTLKVLNYLSKHSFSFRPTHFPFYKMSKLQYMFIFWDKYFNTFKVDLVSPLQQPYMRIYGLLSTLSFHCKYIILIHVLHCTYILAFIIFTIFVKY